MWDRTRRLGSQAHALWLVVVPSLPVRRCWGLCSLRPLTLQLVATFCSGPREAWKSSWPRRSQTLSLQRSARRAKSSPWAASRQTAPRSMAKRDLRPIGLLLSAAVAEPAALWRSRLRLFLGSWPPGPQTAAAAFLRRQIQHVMLMYLTARTRSRGWRSMKLAPMRRAAQTRSGRCQWQRAVLLVQQTRTARPSGLRRMRRQKPAQSRALTGAPHPPWSSCGARRRQRPLRSSHGSGSRSIVRCCTGGMRAAQAAKRRMAPLCRRRKCTWTRRAGSSTWTTLMSMTPTGDMMATCAVSHKLLPG